MREILFRGKSKRHGEWVFGSLIHIGEYCAILELDCEDYGCTYLSKDLGDIDGAAVPIDPETVGQFSGLLDKNGNKIFEGDIVRTRRDGIRTERLKGYYGVDSEGYPKKIPGYDGVGVYHHSCQVDCYASVEFSARHGFYLLGTSMFVDAICNEVVGNIHDNPELLEDKKK